MTLFERIERKGRMIVDRLYSSVGYDPTSRLRPMPYDTVELGNIRASWYVPIDILQKGSICYCVGAGEDISFDIALADRELRVYTFDPTPRAVAYVNLVHDARIHFYPYGVWSANESKRFYAPHKSEYVSHSILNLQKTKEFFDAECKTLKTIMQELGHTHLDMLKLDIEGAEYEVIRSMLADGIYPKVLCVEFDEVHTSLDRHYRTRIRKCCKLLSKAGYNLIRTTTEGNFTFIKTV
jgi:FkbM family methyltransferase